MKLEEHELHSALWLKLSEEIKSRIEVLRRRNDGDLDLTETTRIRGQLMAYKSILVLAEPPAPMQVVENPDP